MHNVLCMLPGRMLKTLSSGYGGLNIFNDQECSLATRLYVDDLLEATRNSNSTVPTLSDKIKQGS